MGHESSWVRNSEIRLLSELRIEGSLGIQGSGFPEVLLDTPLLNFSINWNLSSKMTEPIIGLA